MEAARFAIEYLDLDRLYLIPTGIPPHKQLDAGTPDAGRRLEMVRLAAEALGPGAQACDLELRRDGASYTLDTLRQLRQTCPRDRFYLLMGTDMFLTFHRWRNPTEIAEMCTLCAFGRSEADSQELFAVQREYLRETFHADVMTISLPHIVDISSTRLRGLLAEGSGQEYLDPAVYGYILREGLYGVKRDLRQLPLDELRCVAISMLRRRRVPHVLGTEETAAGLALRWGEDEETARRAALLHDCTKRLDGEQHRAVFRQYNVDMDDEERREEKLYHAISGAALAKHIFGVTPRAESAIRWHTTGKPEMTTLEKILYLADYIEPTRDFCDLSALRELAFRDLDAAMLMGLEMSIQSLEDRGVAVNSYSVRARDYLKGNQR